MNKLLSVLLAGLFAATLSAGAMAADASPMPAPTVTSTSATPSVEAKGSEAKAPLKAAHQSHKKHANHKAK